MKTVVLVLQMRIFFLTKGYNPIEKCILAKPVSIFPKFCLNEIKIKIKIRRVQHKNDSHCSTG